MPCALIRFSFRSTGGVANQFSVHLSLVFVVLFVRVCFAGSIIEWCIAAPLFVGLAVQGVVKCYFGAFRTRFS